MLLRKIQAYIESYSKRMQSDLYSTAEYARDSGNRSDSQENEISTLDSGAASEAATAKATDVSGSGYSETNVRQDGVDEGDTVKTDGTYLSEYRQRGAGTGCKRD